MKYPCQVTKEWWDHDDFLLFYKDGFHAHGIVSVQLPSSRIDPRKIVDGIEYGIFEGKTYKITDQEIIWSNCQLDELMPDVIPDHWHTSFTLNQHEVHIDFISYFRGGPQTSYREYRIFVDGEQMKRGGGRVGFIGGVFCDFKNFPVSVQVDEYLIYINSTLQRWVGSKQGQIDNDQACSVWTLIEQFTVNF